MPMSNTLRAELPTDNRSTLRAIDRLRTTQIRFRDKLAGRLEELLHAYQDDYEGHSLSAGAIDALVTFLDANLLLKRPRVSATPSGDLYAEWTGPGDTLLGVRFTESGEVQYALFAPNTLHQDRMDRASGMTTADTLMEKLAYLPDQRWLSE
jgi:hypothetical protein